MKQIAAWRRYNAFRAAAALPRRPPPHRRRSRSRSCSRSCSRRHSHDGVARSRSGSGGGSPAHRRLPMAVLPESAQRAVLELVAAAPGALRASDLDSGVVSSLLVSQQSVQFAVLRDTCASASLAHRRHQCSLAGRWPVAMRCTSSFCSTVFLMGAGAGAGAGREGSVRMRAQPDRGRCRPEEPCRQVAGRMLWAHMCSDAHACLWPGCSRPCL